MLYDVYDKNFGKKERKFFVNHSNNKNKIFEEEKVFRPLALFPFFDEVIKLWKIIILCRKISLFARNNAIRIV